MMSSCFPFPFRACLECIQGPSLTATQSYAQLHDESRAIRLDHNHMGEDVVLLKENLRICGSGGALGNVPLLQNKSYYQARVHQTGTWGVGLGTRKAALSSMPSAGVWLLRDDGSVHIDDEVECVGKLDEPIGEGETIGIAFDHVELCIYKGEQLVWTAPIKSTGQVFYPCVYVDDGAILDVRFNSATFSPKAPAGYQEIMTEQTLL